MYAAAVGKRLVACVACVACMQGACSKPPIDVDISQPGSASEHFGQIVVQVVIDDKDAVVKVNGETVRGGSGARTSYLPALSMPAGPNQVHVTVITPRLGTRTRDVPFDRTPVDTYLKIDGVSGEMRLIQGPIQRCGIRNEYAQIASAEPAGQLDRNADIARRLLPGADSGFNNHRVAGVDNIA